MAGFGLEWPNDNTYGEDNRRREVEVGSAHRTQTSEAGRCGQGLSIQQKNIGKVACKVQKVRRLVDGTKINGT